MKRHILVVFLFFVVLYICSLVFNHIDAWIGLAMVALNIVGLLYYIEKQFKKEQK